MPHWAVERDAAIVAKAGLDQALEMLPESSALRATVVRLRYALCVASGERPLTPAPGPGLLRRAS